MLARGHAVFLDAAARLGAARPDLVMLAFEALLLRNLSPRSRFDHLTPPEDGGPIEVPIIAGTCLLARRSSFDQLGGFDESFFLYYEDWDLCLRARGAGWLSLLVPAATAVHERGAQRSRTAPTSGGASTRAAIC